jgi:hypothetical protein
VLKQQPDTQTIRNRRQVAGWDYSHLQQSSLEIPRIQV